MRTINYPHKVQSRITEHDYRTLERVLAQSEDDSMSELIRGLLASFCHRWRIEQQKDVGGKDSLG